jgi:hypothetical protein
MCCSQLLSIEEIERLGADLDVFTAGEIPPAELVAKGLHPPLPISLATLIWGFAILREARRLHLERLACLVFPSCSRREMLALALKMENRSGSFTWLEKEKMLRFLGGPGEALQPGRPLPAGLSEQLAGLSPLIEGHPDPFLAQKIGSFMALPPQAGNLVAAGQVDLKTATRAQELPAEVFTMLGGASLTFSQRRQILNELLEVRRKQALSAQAVTAVVAKALKEDRPADAVHRLRFPALSALKQRFCELRGEILGGSGVRLEAPPDFEGDSFNVEFSFNSPKSLRRKIAGLSALGQRSNELFDLLY